MALPTQFQVSGHTVTVRDATQSDLPDLAGRLRGADLAEIRASSGQSPLYALARGLEASERCLVATVDSRPEMIFGIARESKELGLPWMLATPTLLDSTYRTKFIRHSRTIDAWMCAPYKLVTGHVDARNTKHIRWLKWLGYRFIRLVPHYGAESRPFWEFCKIPNV